MRKASQLLIVTSVIGLAVAIVVGIFLYAGGINSNSSPTPTPVVTPMPTVLPTITMTSTPTSTPVAPNRKLTVTYSEVSRNETIIVIHFKLEPNSYVFQLNADSFYLIENGNKVSSNLNDAVIIGTQPSTLYFPINNYNGTNYTMSSNALPSDTTWIRQ
jgi:hypothetical protein